MKWNFIINGAPLGSGDAVSVISGGYARKRNEEIITGVAIAGLASSLASSIWGGAQAARARREQERRLAEEKARNNAWYTRRFNEHTVDTSAGQNMIRMAKDYARENWRKARGASAVAGGTDAAAAMAKEQGNKMVGDAIANIEAQDVARKDNIDASYRASQAQLSQQQMALDQQKAANTSQVAGGVSDALMSGALAVAGSKTPAGIGSPGGGGVDPAPKTSQIEKLGIGSSEKWLKKIPEYNENYQLGSLYAKTPSAFFGL